jgi:hypothetical protein
LKDYHIEFLCGINYSVSQTELALQRLQLKGYHDITNNIHQADIAELANFPKINSENINRVLALDCAYHFPSREIFIEDSYRILTASKNDRTNQKIGLTDIVLAEGMKKGITGNRLSWRKRILLNIMLRLSQIPQCNVITLQEYKQQLAQVGFKQIVSQDISEYVFLPFGHWLLSQEDRIKKTTGKRSVWLKYKITTAFLAWAYKHEVLRYVIISAAVK